MRYPIAILYFGAYEETYPRNRIILSALRKMEHMVEECHISIWEKKTDKTGCFKRGRDALALLLRLLTGYPRLILKYLRAGHYDTVFVGYPGHLDVLMVKFLEVITGRRKKIIFDAFISLYDTIVSDRGMIKPGSFIAGCLFRLDRIACSLADIILLDTDAHILFFRKTFGLPEEKFIRVFAGAETSIFHPGKIQEVAGGFQVLFVGKYTPLHGIEHVVEAADRLRHQKDLRFVFIGRGQLYRPIRAMVKKKNLENISFIEWAPYETLPDYMQRADICLGIFSTSAKANRVIPNKVFQAMAMGKPVVSGKTDAALECLTHMEDIFLCQPGNPAALSKAIMALKSDGTLRNRMAEKSFRTFEADLGDNAAIGMLGEALNRI